MPESHTINGTKVYGTIDLGGGRRGAISAASGQQIIEEKKTTCDTCGQKGAEGAKGTHDGKGR
jgi:hypothetical protein